MSVAQATQHGGLDDSEDGTVSHTLLLRDQSLETESKRRLSSCGFKSTWISQLVYSHHLEYEKPGDQFSQSTVRNHYENIQ